MRERLTGSAESTQSIRTALPLLPLPIAREKRVRVGREPYFLYVLGGSGRVSA
jgi:hypothetical protein